MASFGREVKPWVPCRTFTTVKERQAEIRASEQNVGLFTLAIESDANDLRC